MAKYRWSDEDRELVKLAIGDCRWDEGSDEQADVVLAALEAVLRARGWAPVEETRQSVRADALAIHRPANDWSWQTFGCKHDGQPHTKLCTECGTCYPCRTVIAVGGEIDG